MTTANRMPAIVIVLIVAALALAAVSFGAAAKVANVDTTSPNSALLSHPYNFSGPGR